jgi:hypothetical protein
MVNNKRSCLLSGDFFHFGGLLQLLPLDLVALELGLVQDAKLHIAVGVIQAAQYNQKAVLTLRLQKYVFLIAHVGAGMVVPGRGLISGDERAGPVELVQHQDVGLVGDLVVRVLDPSEEDDFVALENVAGKKGSRGGRLSDRLNFLPKVGVQLQAVEHRGVLVDVLRFPAEQVHVLAHGEGLVALSRRRNVALKLILKRNLSTA